MFNLLSLEPFVLYLKVKLWAYLDNQLHQALPAIIRANEDDIKRELQKLEWSRLQEIGDSVGLSLDKDSVLKRFRESMRETDEMVTESTLVLEGLSVNDVSFVARPVR